MKEEIKLDKETSELATALADRDGVTVEEIVKKALLLVAARVIGSRG